MNLDFDLHVHTFHSPCGQAEMRPAEIVNLAAQRGIVRLGISDHFYPFTDPGIFDEIRAAVDDARSLRNGSLEVYFGCEAEIMSPGRTAGSPELAENLDFVMAGATHFQNEGMTELPPASDDYAIAQHYLKMFEYAVSLPWVDTVAHPFFVVPGVCSVEVLDLIQDFDLLPALELAKENEVAMEISPRAFHRPEQLRFSLRFYPLCKKAGLKFTIGSDAHRLDDVGNVPILQPLITELGLTEKDIWLPESKTR